MEAGRTATYSPADVITRVLDAALGEDDESDEFLCPDCIRGLAEEVIRALEDEGYRVTKRRMPRRTGE